MFESAPLVVEAPGDLALLTDAAEKAAAHWRLPAPTLIRVGANGVFRSGDVILRVGVTTAPMGKAIAFAQRLLACDVRVAAPAREDWLEHRGLSVSAWEWIDFDPDAPVDWERVGASVSRVHAIDPSSVDHPLPFCGDFPWWDMSAMMPESDAVDETARRGMRRALDENRWWLTRTRAAPMTLCHGDVHPGNVLVAADGPVLIDWDLLCVGPAAWDMAPMRRWADRWDGRAGDYEAFRAGYGSDIDEDVLDAIAEMRLLVATLMRLKRARLDPPHADEAWRRLAYWRGDPDAPAWRPQ